LNNISITCKLLNFKGIGICFIKWYNQNN